MTMVKTIEWLEDRVRIIDQLLLPTEKTFIDCYTYADVARIIKEMNIRGAPAIGVAASMGIALGAQEIAAESFAEFETEINQIAEVLAATRPTAVNLFWAIEKMKSWLTANSDKPIPELKSGLISLARTIHDEDIAACKAMGKHGAGLLPRDTFILTHCNAGALATAGYGTALGVIRAAHEQGKIKMVYVDETRPYLQGSRLTAWEMCEENIPATLITDNMAGHFMRKGKINAVVVGADRIAGNGDVANKIGTYMVAVLAKRHNIPFYVAAPVSTLDLSLTDGSQIPIEERNIREITHIKDIQIAPDDMLVANPAFDVTPNELVKAIITELGVVTPPYTENLARIING